MNRAQIVRDKRPFAVWDLLVYALILLLIAVLFVVFVFSDAFGAEDARGVRVEVDGVTVYTYVFGEGGTVSDGWEERIQSREDGEVLFVRISAGDGWNELAVNDGAGTVVMHDADCSFRKDCTVMRAIGEGGSVIVCIPHRLKVVPLEGEDLNAPSVG